MADLHKLLSQAMRASQEQHHLPILDLQDYFCFGCGSPRLPVLVHGHEQCSECGCVVRRCCDD